MAQYLTSAIPQTLEAGANSASPTGDGVANLIKYALGLNPLVAVTNPLVTAAIVRDAGLSYFTLTVKPVGEPR